MPDLIATVGGATSNSFVTEDEFEDFCDARFGGLAVFNATDADDRVRALLDAARDLNKLPYVGTRVNTTQALAWPRQYAVNPDNPNPSWIQDLAELYYSTTEIPDRIKEAQLEYAYEICKNGAETRERPATVELVSKKVGPLETVYNAEGSRAEGLARFPTVVTPLAPLLDDAALGGLDVVRV